MREYLSLVSKPVRYLGQEINSIHKNHSEIKLKFCLAFPDVYEVGMSHLGIQILYHILNERREIVCERVFAPWIDMENLLRQKGIPLVSLEFSTPLKQFDIIGFSLQYELCFTNFLNMLELSNISPLSRDRDSAFPLIIAGGPSTFNPEPISDFFDALVIGDGEEVVLEICDIAIQAKANRVSKDELLESLAKLEGVYVPSKHSQREKIRKRIVNDLDQTPFPNSPIVPYMRVIHDRLSIEIARGCKRGCRFCEAGFIHRPYRERSPYIVEELISTSLKNTGYEEFSLLSLSAGDYNGIKILISKLMDQWERKKVAVSLPSLRIENIVGHLAEEIKRVRKTGFTIAPEAASERLRSVINKQMDENILFQGISDLFSKGWKNIKLYFMIGLPTENQQDLKAIVDLSKKILSIGDRQRVHPNITVSISTFVPKPHTPFQWEGQISLEEMREKLRFLRSELKGKYFRLKWQDPHLSFLEGIFSMGDRKLSQVLIEARRFGCRFDGWSDQFKYSLWKEAFEKVGIDMNSYTQKKGAKEKLPWSFIDTGIKSEFLWIEYEKGLNEKLSPACVGKNCFNCGVCDEKIHIKEGKPLGIEMETKKEKTAWIRKSKVRRKIRLKFKKIDDMRFLSHLELAQLFFRASNRADIPICFSEGFHPMPRIVFFSALPVGIESLSEIVDIEVEGNIPADDIKERLNFTLPKGIEILEAYEIPIFLNFSPPEKITYLVYLDPLISKEEAAMKIKEALEKDVILINQKRKTGQRVIDVCPIIESMEVKGDKSDWSVELVLRNLEGRKAKPSEIIYTIMGLKKDADPHLKIIKI